MKRTAQKALIPGATLRMGLCQGRTSHPGCGTILLGDLWATAQAYRPTSTRTPRVFSRYPGDQLMFIPDAARAMDAVNVLRRNLSA